MALSTVYRPGYSLQSPCRVELDGWSCGAPGDLDNDGTAWFMQPLEGWHDAPTPRLNMAPRPSAHGAFDGNAYYEPRVVSIPGIAVARTLNLAKKARDIVASVAGDPARGLLPMTVYTPGSPTMTCQVRRSTTTKTSAITGSAGFMFSLIVVAPDPRRYAAAALSPAVGLPQTGTGGLTFPLLFPLKFGSGASGGQMAVQHTGTTAVWPVWSILGPVSGPAITNVDTGEILSFDPAFTVPAGVTCVVNTDLKTVTMQGVNRRDALVRAGWFELQPGTTNIRFTSTGLYDPAATLTAMYAEAWS
jgi:hypothetical protein